MACPQFTFYSLQNRVQELTHVIEYGMFQEETTIAGQKSIQDIII